ncbi:hypothetical protein ACQP1G_20485 [Nocardia sp. CA-107356]|uniref:hypothetical protein n=1 Tax=Nocardia sp. CA-107356 TaxID=3239972 RepID=UPI003D8F8BFC
MELTFAQIRFFATYLASLAWPPSEMRHLTPEHIDGYHQSRRGAVADPARDLQVFKRLLRDAEGLDEAVVIKLHEKTRRRIREAERKNSYSRAEFKRLADAARGDLRAAAARIRGNRLVLEQYREGRLEDPDRRLELLDFVDRNGEVPRRTGRLGSGGTREMPLEWVFRFGSVVSIVGWAHLTRDEVTAAAIQLSIMTGQNPSVIAAVTAAHHRADGHSGELATAILDARKPRRGRRAHITMALSEVPDWISIPERPHQLSARDELHTPFGVYSLLVELTARSREIAGVDSLLLGYRSTNGSAGRGLRRFDPDTWMSAWSRRHNLPSDAIDGTGRPLPLTIRLDWIRLTYLKLHQKPIAHTESTLVNDYLIRNRGNLAEYRKVVADALAEELDKARARGVMARVTKADITRARTDPDTVAAEHGVDVMLVEPMIGGDLDTVMNACIANDDSPHSPAGEPCRASFMQCLDCPCARALPHHLPIQILVHDRLEARRAEMTPLSWAQRFALPHAQLADLISRHDDADIADARAAAGDADRALVERFLDRELDLR